VIPTQRAYWRDWAHELGWDEATCDRAGEIGSLAVRRGMTPAEAADTVLARVRDSHEVKIGPSGLERILRHPAFPSIAVGIVALMAALALVTARLVKNERVSGDLALAALAGFVIALALQFFAAIYGFAKGGWRLTLIGIALTLGATVLFMSFPNFVR
jgi:hypothetical protein